MTAVNPATPLLSLDAVSLDTETTGLDLRKARLLEVGAVRIASGRIDGAGSFHQLINPGEAIPAFSTAIHGIDNEKVAGAPSFANMWPQLSAFIGDAVIIGHTIGFDLAMMAQECRRAGLTFEKPRSLDTQFLAQLINPRLTGQSLGQLADWLGVEVTDRHSALGDALTTARVFQAMVPKLREGGIRTYAEAAQACRALTDVMDRQYRAGWMTADSVRERDSQPVPSRIDSYPYRHRIRDVMSSPPKIIAAERTLGEALAQLIEARISSLLVVPPGVTPEKLPAYSLGIITERDVMRALAIEGEGALKLGIEQFMSRPLATIPAEAFVYRAIGRMSRLKIRHLGVIDEAGLVIGALSARDLLRLRAEEAVSLGDEIDEAEDVHALGAAWAKLPQVATSLLAEEIGAVDVAAIVSRELGALTRKAVGDCRAAPARSRAGRAAMPLRGGGAGLGRSRRKPARDGSGQCHRVRARRSGRCGGSIFRGARRASRRHSERRRRALLQGRRDGEERCLARLGRDLAGPGDRLDRAVAAPGSHGGRHLLRSARGARRTRDRRPALAFCL